MNTEQNELWQRIQAVSFDGEDTPSLPFTARLARENGWTREFAQRAIEEYKRFTFLAMTAGHTVCPSEQVDQVWHLHLTYTRSYWDRFCKEVLGRPLHHDPTRGGEMESLKHERMYEATLTSYRQLFECEPPAEFWPSAAVRFGDDAHHRQVNTRQNWIVPKGPCKRAVAVGLLLALTGVLTGCFGPVVADAQADREMYLLLYVVALIGAFAVATMIRRNLRQPEDAIEIKDGQLDEYDYALLAGGPIRVFDVGLVKLLDSGAIKHNGSDKFFVAGPLPQAADPIESHLYDLVAYGEESGRLLDVIRKSVQFDLEPRRQQLREWGLWLNDSRSVLSCVLPVGLMLLAVLGLGLGRVVAGFEHQKPNGFLLFLMVAGFLTTMVVFGKRSRRTLRGDAYLKNVQTGYATITPHTLTHGQNLVLGTALLGTAALAATEYSSLATLLHPKNDPTSSGSGCGSGCGGSGCGGGGCGGGCGGGGD